MDVFGSAPDHGFVAAAQLCLVGKSGDEDSRPKLSQFLPKRDIL
jgi:hypothetical protein